MNSVVLATIWLEEEAIGVKLFTFQEGYCDKLFPGKADSIAGNSG